MERALSFTEAKRGSRTLFHFIKKAEHMVVYTHYYYPLKHQSRLQQTTVLDFFIVFLIK